MNPTYDFRDRVAVVTGAGSGMGFATAKAFAESRATWELTPTRESRNTQPAGLRLRTSLIEGDDRRVQLYCV
jgi:NAD(P)-dependent dehydrogenase (short-subunit alcohol dehydrogenase family)